jgi:hypothetical protein
VTIDDARRAVSGAAASMEVVDSRFADLLSVTRSPSWPGWPTRSEPAASGWNPGT